MNIVVARATAADLPFMEAMLLEAANWDPQAPKLSRDELLAIPEMARYLEGWGRAGDLALVARTPDGAAVGAAWCRLFPASAPAYGFIDEATPELAIATIAAWRGRGLGGRLLAALIADARAMGTAALSLSVSAENPAKRLYERHGFASVSAAGGSLTMRLDLGHALR